MKKLYLAAIVLFCILFKNDVYAGNVEDEIFLCVGEKYVMEHQEGVSPTYTSENEEIAAVEEKVITGISPGETDIIIKQEDDTEKRLHVFVGDYKLCLGQEKTMVFDLSSIMNAWDSSVRSSDTSVVSARKLGYDTNDAEFSFYAVSTGMTNITISSRGSVLEDFTLVVSKHTFVYFEQVDPTCTQEGSIAHYECLFCGECSSDEDGKEILDDVSIDRTEHDYAVTEMQEPTCSTAGYAVYECQSCGDAMTQKLPAEHAYEISVVKPDCVNSGYTIGTCTRCGKSYKDSFVNALGHNYVVESYINRNSIIQKRCKNCGDPSYDMNLNGVLINETHYPQTWGDLSDYYMLLNQEYTITSNFESFGSTGLTIRYKRPIRDSEGALKIYDIKTVYKDLRTGRIRYDNAINNITFSYEEDYFGDDVSEVVAGPGVSQCALKMDYEYDDDEIDDDDMDGELSYYVSRDMDHLVLGVSFKVKFESEDQNPYVKIPMQEIEFSKRKIKIAKGFSKKLVIAYDKHGEYMARSLKWKSSNKKIATVNSSGKVKAKKTGKCTITCQLPNGKKAKCKVTVVKNEYKGKSLSQCNARKGSYGTIHFEVNKAYYKGNNLVLRCVVMNTRIFKADKFNWITISATDKDGRVLAKKRFENIPINIGAYGKTYITFTFPKNAVKKKRELHEGVWIKTNYNYQYSH